MSVHAWLQPEPERPSGGVAATVAAVLGEPDADGVLEVIPWARIARPLYRERIAAIAALYDGLTPEQRARLNPADLRQAHNVVDRAYLGERYQGLVSALVCLQALVQYGSGV